MHRELEKFTNQARFVQMIIDGKLVVSKKKKMVLVQELKEKKFKAFHKVAEAIKEGELAPIADHDEEEQKDEETGAAAYDYLLGMPIWSLTKERVEKLLKQVSDKEMEVDALIKLSKEDLWTRDLDDFIAEWRFQLADEAKRQKHVANMGRRASTKLKIAGGPPGRKRKAGLDDSDESDFDGSAPARVKKAAAPKPSKPVGGMLSYLAPEPKKTSSKSKAPSTAIQRALDMDLFGATKKEAAPVKEKSNDLWMDLDGPASDAPKVTKPKAGPPAKKTAPAQKVEIEAENSDDDEEEEVIRPAAGRQPRAAAAKPVKYNTLSDESDGDDMLFDVGKLVKGIDTASASADHSRPLFSASMSRPSSSGAGLPKKSISAKQTFDIHGDDTDYSKLAPPTINGPASTAGKTVLSDEDEGSFDEILPASPKTSKLKPAPKAKPVPRPGPKAKAPAKKATGQPPEPKKMPLSPAAKAYAAKKAKQEKLAAEAANSHSDDEVEKVANELLDEDDEDASPVGRRPARRAATAPKKKWIISDESDENEESTMNFDGGDSD